MPFSLTEDQIREIEKQEVLETLLAHDAKNWWFVPGDVAFKVREKTRLRWVTWTAERDATDPGSRHDKTDKLHAFVQSNPDRVISMTEMQEFGECSRGTVYKYLADNRSAFRDEPGRGMYRIVDVATARAEAGRPVAPGSTPTARTAPDAVSVTERTVNAALGAMTGHVDTPAQPAKTYGGGPSKS